ncbi:MAG: putative ligase-like protein, partial [Nitrososphaeraceae archaeon]|nr:putative ligase-like protein [Nitrososphaeraceae archaeon]
YPIHLHSMGLQSDSFALFVSVCEEIQSSTSKNKKVDILSKYLAKLSEDSLPLAARFLGGRIFPKGSALSLNLGFTTIMNSLCEIAELTTTEIQQIYLKYGDLGKLGEYAISKKHTVSLFQQLEKQDTLTMSYVFSILKKIADIEGAGSNKDRKKNLTGLLISCSPMEGKYLIKIMNGELRIGLVEGLVELALAKAFDSSIKDIREAMLLSGDIGSVSLLAKNKTLNTMEVRPLSPLSFMLADVMFTAEEVISYYGKSLICEYKYDGIRVQLHKFRDTIRMFSRKLEDIAFAFPEIVEAFKNESLTSFYFKSSDFILDGEIIGFKNSKPLHFQELQKRLRRKKLTDKFAELVPVIYVVYDILYLEGEQLIKQPLSKRKEILSKIQFRQPILNSTYILTDSIVKIVDLFNQSKEMGHEGLVIKDPSSQYHPGKRGRHWIKLKKELDTIDAVIVIAEYGHGKRAGVLSDYTFAVKDLGDGRNSLKVIGKAYSGLTDREIYEMTDRLRLATIKNEGYRLLVRPEIILEVAFDSIQKSNRHNSGFSLRFPRIKSIRTDKSIAEVDSLQKVIQIYEKQVHQTDK